MSKEPQNEVKRLEDSKKWKYGESCHHTYKKQEHALSSQGVILDIVTGAAYIQGMSCVSMIDVG